MYLSAISSHLLLGCFSQFDITIMRFQITCVNDWLCSNFPLLRHLLFLSLRGTRWLHRCNGSTCIPAHIKVHYDNVPNGPQRLRCFLFRAPGGWARLIIDRKYIPASEDRRCGRARYTGRFRAAGAISRDLGNYNIKSSNRRGQEWLGSNFQIIDDRYPPNEWCIPYAVT